MHNDDPVSYPLPQVRIIKRVTLRHSRLAFRTLKHADCDGVSHKVQPGAWAFYIPSMGLKLLHARNDKQLCLRKSARRFSDPTPSQQRDNATARADDTKIGNYFVHDWDRALAKSVSRRVAETWIASRRLANAGLGPDVSNIVVVKDFNAPYTNTPSMTAGYFQDNAFALPAGPNPDADAMLAVGVRPDQIRSCVRQLANGYIIDLNSVVGVVPLDAEAEIAALTAHIQAV